MTPFVPPSRRKFVGPLLPRGLGSQRHLIDPADPNRTLLAGVADLALPTLGGLGPHSHGTPETGLGRDRGRHALGSRTLAPPIVATYSG